MFLERIGKPQLAKGKQRHSSPQPKRITSYPTRAKLSSWRRGAVKTKWEIGGGPIDDVHRHSRGDKARQRSPCIEVGRTENSVALTEFALELELEAAVAAPL